jgi:hypothetical protein
MRARTVLPAALGAAALALLGYATTAFSADHQDAPATTADPTVDINDVYDWMDGNNVVLVMTVFPDAPSAAKFSDAVKYVFHTASASTFGTTSNPVDIIATFDASQKIQLWVGTSEYVTGDASQSGGLQTADGKVKVFAGLRADPFFFNLDGFKQAVTDIDQAAPSLNFDPAGCPTIDNATSVALGNQLKTSPDGGPPVDHFVAFNTLAIVVSVDKSLLTAGGPLVAVSGATTR